MMEGHRELYYMSFKRARTVNNFSINCILVFGLSFIL